MHIVATGKPGDPQLPAAESLAESFAAAGLRVLLDDRVGVSPGIKFNDADLIGIPTIVVVGRGLADGVVELKDRATGVREDIPVADIQTPPARRPVCLTLTVADSGQHTRRRIANVLRSPGCTAADAPRPARRRRTTRGQPGALALSAGWGGPPGTPFMPEFLRASAASSLMTSPIWVGSSIAAWLGPRTQPSAMASVCRWPRRRGR